MFPASSLARDGSPIGWTVWRHGRSPWSRNTLPPSIETEYPLRLRAAQQTSESLKPTTTLSPTATTLVSLWVFWGEASSSFRQVTWKLPVMLGSALQWEPELPLGWIPVRFNLPLRRAATRSPAADT